MAISDKLNYLLETKQAIKQALIDKGQEVADTDTFRSYAEKIEAIEAGGSGGSGGAYDIEQVLNEATGAYELRITDAVGGEGEALDPVKVYKETRPKDWLNMMGTGRGENYDEMETYYDTHDNEIRLLFHLSPPNINLLAFACYAENTPYNVSYTKANGDVVSIDMTSASKCELELDYDDFGNETSDGFRQVLIVIKPTDNTKNITWFEISSHSLKSQIYNYKNWNVVELMGKCTNATSVKVSGSNTAGQQLMSLKYYSLFGSNSISNMERMFTFCRSLVTIPQLDTGNATNVSYFFNNCSSLIAMPCLNTSNATQASSMFDNCSSLTAIPYLDIGKVRSLDRFFYQCRLLTTIPQLDTSSATRMSNMFYGCSNLKSVPLLDTSNVTNMSEMFISCIALEEIPQFNTSNVTNMGSILSGCYNLKSIPLLDTSKVTNMQQMFSSCLSLTTIPQLDTSSATTMNSMFNGCVALKKIPHLNTKNVTGMQTMFNSCASLKEIPELDMSSIASANSISNIFSGCYALTNLTITATDWAGVSFTINQCSLDYEALLNLLGSLPPITGTATVTLTSNIGTAQLSAEVAGGTPPAEYTQAVTNGWTIAL